MTDITKKYTNGEVTIVWKPNSCIPSQICWSAATGLPEVFDRHMSVLVLKHKAMHHGTSHIGYLQGIRYVSSHSRY